MENGGLVRSEYFKLEGSSPSGITQTAILCSVYLFQGIDDPIKMILKLGKFAQMVHVCTLSFSWWYIDYANSDRLMI